VLFRSLKRISADIEKLGDADNVSGLDDKLRRAISSSKDYQLQSDLKEIRDTLRLGMPDESRAKLKAVDAVYPNYLTVERASAKAGATGGLPTAKQLLTSSAAVAKKKRAALGQQPFLNDIVNSGLLEKPDIGPTSPLGRAKTLQSTLEKSKASPHHTAWSALASTAALSSLIPGVGALPLVGIGAGMGAGRALTTPAAQRFVAGQTSRQKQLAEALRKGDMAKYTQALSRFGAGQATGE
jgi:hypothetical protein